MSKEAPSNDSDDKEIQPKKTVPQEYCDTRLLSFPQRVRKPSVDEQFARFVEVIQLIHINVPLLDAMQVPTYARYLKDIFNNKRQLPTMEVVKLMEHCSNLILHKLAERGDSTLFQHIFIPSPKFALKFIQALIVFLKFKSFSCIYTS